MTPAPAALSRFLILDGHAYAYRAFHAIGSMSGPTGRPTNAIYGFVKMLQRLRGALEPTHVAVVWDGGLAAERLELLPGYKANRPAMPASLEQQILEILQWVEASGLRSFQVEGAEADDLIAALARCSAREHLPVVIASSDKDFMQLVGEGIGLLNPADRSGAIWSAAEVEARTGVSPAQIVDWLSLIGDAVDNIPGVRGVGPKTAAALLRRFGSWEVLRARLADVEPARLREELGRSVSRVERNRSMIRLRDDLPVEPGPADCRPAVPDLDRLRSLYGQWGFRSLLVETRPGSGAVQPDLFG